MQPIALNSSLPSVGAANADSWRDVQVALRELQKLRGQTPGAGNETLTVNPVIAAMSVERGRLTGRQTAAVAEDPNAPTGPRPTFRTTPLERMRDHALTPDPAIAEHTTDPAPAHKAPENVREEATPQNTLKALYGETRQLEPTVAAKRSLDIVT